MKGNEHWLEIWDHIYKKKKLLIRIKFFPILSQSRSESLITIPFLLLVVFLVLINATTPTNLLINYFEHGLNIFKNSFSILLGIMKGFYFLRNNEQLSTLLNINYTSCWDSQLLGIFLFVFLIIWDKSFLTRINLTA